MIITHFNGLFPYITIENIYDDDELYLIWEELNFLCHNKNFLPPEKSGTATDEGKILKRNKCIWLDDFYSDRKNSNILELNKKAISLDNQEKIFRKNTSWFFKNIEPRRYNTLISYYENDDYYHPHKDCALVTALTWFYKEPKKFRGGDLLLHYDKEAFMIEVKTNIMVLFPSCITHSVTKIQMKEEDCNKKNGRFCMTQFLHPS